MRTFLSILLIALTFGFCFGCSRDSSQSSVSAGSTSMVLGFSQLGSESGWRIGNTKSIKEATAAAGVDLIYLNAEQKYENQINHIRRLIAYQVDIIAFSPIVSTGWENVLQEAKDAGIPVMLTDRSIRIDDTSLYTLFIGADFEEEGRMAGRFLLQYLAKKSGGSQKTTHLDEAGESIDISKNIENTIRVVELRGTEDSTPAIGRSQGFRTIIQDNPNITIVYSEDGDFMLSRGKEIMQKVLATGEPFDVLYSHNDAMTYGAIEAMEELSLKPGEDIVIITVDGEQKSINLLQEGKVNCVVECTPHIGTAIVQAAKDIMAGKSLPKEIFMEEEMFTMWDNLSNLPERGY